MPQLPNFKPCAIFLSAAFLTAVVSFPGSPRAVAGQGGGKPPVWVKDASRAALPTGKITGTLSGSPFTVKKAVWRRDVSLGFSDGPLDIMTLEVSGTSKKPHGLGMPMDIDMSDLPKEVRAELARKAKAASPNALTFVFTISVSKGASVDGKELVHRLEDRLGVPENATPAQPVLVGMELRTGESDTLSLPYTLRLKFGPRRGAVQTGSLYLCLNDGKKSVLAGTFEAAVK